MEKADVLRLVRKFTDYYNVKTLPSTKTVEMWIETLRPIRAEATQFIVESITDSHEKLPGNFPLAVKKAYREWLDRQKRENGGKRESVDCQECTEGLIFVRKDGCGFVFRCAQCRQSGLMAIPSAYTYDLMTSGYELN